MDIMRYCIKSLSKHLLKLNLDYKDLHKGEECYVFGNGDSLKYYNLELFNNKLSFGCNLLRAHKEFTKLNLTYYVSIHPLLYSPIWRGMKSGLNFEINPYYDLVTKFNNTGYIHFVHVSNYCFIRDTTKFRFVHNLDKFPLGLNKLDFTYSCSFVGGAMETMIGLAIYMGFKKVYLVGCDYFFFPSLSGHFWNEVGPIISVNSLFSNELFNIMNDKIDTVVITRKGLTSRLRDVQYETLFHEEENYRNPNKIIEENDLLLLEKTLYTRK